MAQPCMFHGCFTDGELIAGENIVLLPAPDPRKHFLGFYIINTVMRNSKNVAFFRERTVGESS